MQKQLQDQGQEQIQWHYMSRGVNALLSSFNRLEDVEQNIPKTISEASKSSPEMMQEVDNCITNVLASTLEIKHYETFDSLKKRIAVKVLEWLSLRTNKESDIIDELCSIVLYNCVGIYKDVPSRVQSWDGKISEQDLFDYSQAIVNSQYDLEKSIEEQKKGRSSILDEIQKLENADFTLGISRIQKNNTELSKRLHELMED